MVLIVEGEGSKRRIVSVGVSELSYTLLPGQEFRHADWLGWRKTDVHWDEDKQQVVLEPYPLSASELAAKAFSESMVLTKFAKILLLELNAIRAGLPRPAEVTTFINTVKDFL